VGIAAMTLVVLLLFGVSIAIVQAQSSASSVLIGKGRDSRLAWVAFLEGPSAGGSTHPDPSKPCLTLRVAYPTSRDKTGLRHYQQGETTECREVAEGLPVIQSFGVGKGRTEETVLVVVYPASATKMALYLRGKMGRTVRLRRLSSTKVAELSINPVGLWADSVSGSFCLRRVKFYAPNGRTLNDSGRIPCRIQR
jgi:hypothetical protein